MVQSEAASSRTHHLLSLWAITLHKILLTYKDHVSPSRLPDFQVGNFSVIPSALFALLMRLVISSFLATTKAITFVLLNLHFFAVYVLLPCFPVSLLYNLSRIEQSFQPVPLLFHNIQNTSSFLYDLVLRPCTSPRVSSSSPSLTLTLAFCYWCLLLSLLNVAKFYDSCTQTLSSFLSLFFFFFLSSCLSFHLTISSILKSIQVSVPLFSAPFLKGSGKATIQWVGVLPMMSRNLWCHCSNCC